MPGSRGSSKATTSGSESRDGLNQSASAHPPNAAREGAVPSRALVFDREVHPCWQ